MMCRILSVSAVAIFATSAIPAGAVTYQLVGSTLKHCAVERLDIGDDTPRPCTKHERKMYKPPAGYTLDGKIHIDEKLLEQYMGASLVNADIPPEEITGSDAFTFHLANIGPFAEDYFALKTDSAKRPLSWLFYLGDSAPEYGESQHPEGYFVGPNGVASYRKLDPETLVIASWTGAGGKLSVVPLPATAPFLLACLGALGLVSRRRHF